MKSRTKPRKRPAKVYCKGPHVLKFTPTSNGMKRECTICDWNCTEAPKVVHVSTYVKGKEKNGKGMVRLDV
jgi:hypothetical protein